jgi:NADH dehydrogenase
MKPFAYRTRGVFVDLGRFEAVAVLFRLRLSGRSAWLLTRGYHLKQVPTPQRKLRLISDWVIDLFRRDTTDLGGTGGRIDAPGAPALDLVEATAAGPTAA